MSDNTVVPNDTSAQVESSPKTPSKRKLTSTERALAESEELVKSLGGSTEGGRRTRSSTRGVPLTPTPPRPAKKPRVSTPRRGKKVKDAEDEPTEVDEIESNNDAVEKETAESPKPADVTDSKDTNESATNNSIDKLSTKNSPIEKMEVDGTVESTTGKESVSETVSTALTAGTEKINAEVQKNEVAEEAPVVADSTETKEQPEVPVTAEPPVDKTPAVVPTVEVTPAPAVESTLAVESTPADSAEVASDATTEEPVSASTPEEPATVPAAATSPVPVPDEVPVQNAEATPVVQPESELEANPINRNGEVTPTADSQTVDQKPAIESSLKLDNVANAEPTIKPVETISETNAAV